MLIGVSGYARTGKDTVSNILVENYGFVRIGFADALKECMYVLNPWVPIKISIPIPDTIADIARIGETQKPQSEFKMRRLREIVDESGWEEAKEVPEVRRLLQRMGTEVVRDIVGTDTWVDIAMRKAAEHPNVVISDLRFPNEHEAVREVGEAWRVSRPGQLAHNDHSSETALDDAAFDRWILNDGTLLDLETKVGEAVIHAEAAAHKNQAY